MYQKLPERSPICFNECVKRLWHSSIVETGSISDCPRADDCGSRPAGDCRVTGERHGDAVERIRQLEQELGECRLAAEKLRDSNDRLSDFMSTASDLLWETDAEMRMIRGERVIKKDRQSSSRPYSGVIATTFAGKTTIEALGRDPATDPAMAAYVEAIQARKPYRGFEYAIPLPDDKALWMESNGNPGVRVNRVPSPATAVPPETLQGARRTRR